VVPGVADIALQTEDDAEVVVLETGRARAALDVAPAKLDRDGGSGPGRRAAQRGRLLCAQQRIVAVDVDRGVLEERAGRRGEDVRAVMHEHELSVRLGPRRDLVVREEAGEIAIVLA